MRKTHHEDSPAIPDAQEASQIQTEDKESKKKKRRDAPPDLPGLPGVIAKAAHQFRKATQIFPPFGMGIGAGLGGGCGIGWPLRAAYGPPRAMCGAMVGVGMGLGYGQGFGRRFGRDLRPDQLTKSFGRMERSLDAVALTVMSTLRTILLLPKKFFQRITAPTPKPVAITWPQSRDLNTIASSTKYVPGRPLPRVTGSLPIAPNLLMHQH